MLTTDTSPSLRALPAALPSGELDMEDDFDERRSASDLIAEMDARNAAARVVDAREDPEDAKRLVRDAFVARRKLTPMVADDYAIDCAMAKILGLSVTPFVVPVVPEDEEKQWAAFALRCITNAWTMWADGRKDAALEAIERFKRRQHKEERVHSHAGGMNLLSMYTWAVAIEALANGNIAEARRFWRRAQELASTHATTSSTLIQWTYVASFF